MKASNGMQRNNRINRQIHALRSQNFFWRRLPQSSQQIAEWGAFHTLPIPNNAEGSTAISTCQYLRDFVGERPM